MTDKSKPDQPPVISDGVCDGLAKIVGGHTYANAAKPDRQDDGLLNQIRTIKATCLNISESEATRLGTISERCDDILEAWVPTREAAEGATVEVPHEDCLNCRCPPDERCAGYRVAPPQPAPDAVRGPLDSLLEVSIRAESNSESASKDDKLTWAAHARRVREAVAAISIAITTPAPDAVRAVDAFDLGFAWAWGLRGQSVEDSRAVGRTLRSDLFMGIDINLDGFDSFQNADEGIVEAKRRIKAALSTPVPSADGVRAAQKQQNRNYAASAMMVCIALADEVVCAKGSAADVVKALRERAKSSAPVPLATGAAAPVAWQFRQRSAVGKGAQSQLPWCDWCSINREDYERYIREPNKLVEVRALYTTPPVRGDRTRINTAADEVVQRVVEYNDRTSPEDFPEALLITPSELHNELTRFADDLSLPVQPGAGEY